VFVQAELPVSEALGSVTSCSILSSSICCHCISCWMTKRSKGVCATDGQGGTMSELLLCVAGVRGQGQWMIGIPAPEVCLYWSGG